MFESTKQHPLAVGPNLPTSQRPLNIIEPCPRPRIEVADSSLFCHKEKQTKQNKRQRCFGRHNRITSELKPHLLSATLSLFNIKKRLKNIKSLSSNWYQCFRHVEYQYSQDHGRLAWFHPPLRRFLNFLTQTLIYLIFNLVTQFFNPVFLFDFLNRLGDSYQIQETWSHFIMRQISGLNSAWSKSSLQNYANPIIQYAILSHAVDNEDRKKRMLQQFVTNNRQWTSFLLNSIEMVFDWIVPSSSTNRHKLVDSVYE